MTDALERPGPTVAHNQRDGCDRHTNRLESVWKMVRLGAMETHKEETY